MAHGITSTGYSYPDGTTSTSAAANYVAGDYISSVLEYGLNKPELNRTVNHAVLTANRKSIVQWNTNQYQYNSMGVGATESYQSFGTAGTLNKVIITFPASETGQIIQFSCGSGIQRSFALFSTGNLYTWNSSANADYTPSVSYLWYSDYLTYGFPDPAGVDGGSLGYNSANAGNCPSTLINYPKLSAGNVQRVYEQGTSLYVRWNTGTFGATGLNSNGELGLNKRNPPYVKTYYSIADNTTGYETYSYWMGWWGIDSIAANTVDVDKFFPLTYGAIIQKTDGSIWATGKGMSTRFGNGSTADLWTFTDISSYWGGTGGGDIKECYALDRGSGSTIIMRRATNSTTETIYTCGQNDVGQCGDGTTTARTTVYTRVLGTNGSDALGTLAVNNRGSVYYLRAGTLYRWGLNTAGQLGNNTVTNVTTPISSATSPGGSSWSVILNRFGTYDNDNSTIFVKDTSGRVYSAGYNGYSQRCLGMTTATNNFQECIHLRDCVQISMSGHGNGFSYYGIIPAYSKGGGIASKARLVQWGHANWNECWTYTGFTGTNPNTPISVLVF